MGFGLLTEVMGNTINGWWRMIHVVLAQVDGVKIILAIATVTVGLIWSSFFGTVRGRQRDPNWVGPRWAEWIKRKVRRRMREYRKRHPYSQKKLAKLNRPRRMSAARKQVLSALPLYPWGALEVVNYCVWGNNKFVVFTWIAIGIPLILYGFKVSWETDIPKKRDPDDDWV